MEFGPIKLQWRNLVQLCGLTLCLPLGLLVVFASYTPITTSGVFYLGGAVGVAIGMLCLPRRPRLGLLLAFVGLWAIVATASIRVLIDWQGSSVRIITLPEASETRWLNRLIHERDLALFGQRVAAFTGVGLSWQESEGLSEALTAAYASLDNPGRTTSSPCLSTYFFLQRPTAFDTVVVEPPPMGKQQTSAVIYLHGFTGNFTVQAWLIAQAVRPLNMLTVAPSVGFIGDWWTPHGEETLRRTIEYLRKRGIRQIYLAGLSNGAVGACRLAPKFRADLAGLILISGADTTVINRHLPTLALQGRDDERMSFELARDYAAYSTDYGTYHEFPGDHLLLAKQAPAVQAVLEAWLRRQTAATYR